MTVGRFAQRYSVSLGSEKRRGAVRDGVLANPASAPPTAHAGAHRFFAHIPETLALTHVSHSSPTAALTLGMPPAGWQSNRPGG